LAESYNIPNFLKYLNIDSCKSNAVNVTNYDDHKNFKLKSEPVAIDFYFLAIKSNFTSNIDYGQTRCDESDSYLFLDRPGGALKWDLPKPPSGYHFLIHPKLFKKYARDYNFIDYENHNALFLMEDEKNTLLDIFKKAYVEYGKKDFSTKILLSYANLILSYLHFFYERQFETHSKIYDKIVADFYDNLDMFFDEKEGTQALPTVSFFAKKSNLSPNYFGDVIQYFTGSSPSEHIHERIISMAKNRLHQRDLTINEIAYSLGFEYPTYFARLFKKQTGMTPTEFRNQ
jgi:AraC-like DNA-binding protein